LSERSEAAIFAAQRSELGGVQGPPPI